MCPRTNYNNNMGVAATNNFSAFSRHLRTLNPKGLQAGHREIQWSLQPN
jgi:hypothetical protein